MNRDTLKRGESSAADHGDPGTAVNNRSGGSHETFHSFPAPFLQRFSERMSAQFRINDLALRSKRRRFTQSELLDVRVLKVFGSDSRDSQTSKILKPR